jgi:hypothetical protein
MPQDRAIDGPAVKPTTAPATAPIGPSTTAPDNAPKAASPTRSWAIAAEDISARESATLATSARRLPSRTYVSTMFLITSCMRRSWTGDCSRSKQTRLWIAVDTYPPCCSFATLVHRAAPRLKAAKGQMCRSHHRRFQNGERKHFLEATKSS